MGRTKQAESDRAAKRAKVTEKEGADDDSDAHSVTSDGSFSFVDSDEGELTNESSSNVEVVSKDGLARKSSSASTR